MYTSADSVFQIAAHEAIVPVPELYRACEIAYTLVGEGLGVGRVIAGRSSARRARSSEPPTAATTRCRPPGETLLDRLTAASIPVVAIGKIDDLFAGRGISVAHHTASDDEGMDRLERADGAMSIEV